MGRTPRIPLELKSRPFSLDEARALGLSKSVLRGKSWERIGAQMFRWKGASDDKLALIHAYRRALPVSAVFVGRTAAWIHGLDVEPANPIQVAADGIHSRLGLEVRHSDVDGETEEIKGVRVSSLSRTALDLCAWLPAAESLVVLDMALAAGRLNRESLRRYTDRMTGRPGVARLRSLADIAAPAESPMETRLRWLLVKAGLPPPEVQVDLHDDAGRFVGRADLYYRSAHLIIEFDGANHRNRLTSDDRRQNALVGAEYRVLRFTASDIYSRPETVVAQVARILRAVT